MDTSTAAEILNKGRHGKRVSRKALSAAGRALGASSASKAGHARALKLSPERRQEISARAAEKAAKTHRRRALLKKLIEAAAASDLTEQRTLEGFEAALELALESAPGGP